ncbi:MAG: helicase-related protein, partial [Bacteroidales bacterium]|nr:helicase-related protein [Bacteroidales bacterium]
RKRRDQSGIVYCATRKAVEEVCELLRDAGFSAARYHAGLEAEERRASQEDFLFGRVQVMVATNAFGMGIDKPDVRVVIHVDVPNSLEEYYQEAGRAGRDGKRSYAVLLTGSTDQRTLRKHITDAFPERDFIKQVYEMLGNNLHIAVGEGYQRQCEFNFNLFCKTFKFPILPAHSALKLLTQAGYIEYVEEMDHQSRVMIMATKEELYSIHTSNEQVDHVLQALLRTYSGLFSDYVFINEALLSHRYGFSEQQIYEALIELTHQHVLHYIPRKRTAYIIFTTSREEPRYVQIPLTIYEHQRERMEQRIEAVISYAFEEEACREQTLLAYFGEQSEGRCGNCDVCITAKQRARSTSKDVRDGILYMAQVKPRRIEEFVSTLAFPSADIMSALSYLVDEGFLRYNADDETYTNPVPLE